MRKFKSEQLIPSIIKKNGRFQFQAGVLPDAGGNLISFSIDDVELLHWNPQNLLDNGNMTGAFNMFPTTCRLDGCKYNFEGRQIVQVKDGEEVFIHGLIRDESLSHEVTENQVKSWIDIYPGHPVYEGFPFTCRFSITHTLLDSGLEVRIELSNKDDCRIPFSYGIHAYWKIHGSRELTKIRIPCDRLLIGANGIMAGATEAVEAKNLDFRSLRSLDNLYLDRAFWPRENGETAEMVLGSTGLGLSISASNLFKHMIVYSPEGEEFICVENLTSCPNAPNLHDQGFEELANLVIVEPGEKVDGWIRYEISQVDC